ncbi:WcaF family extracellular polysaccharide biosynthesis acetyltransferase [Pedobacter alluvionis]|uniref:Colanic acid biosynthesis acetyltransferase WcaF n=1 Tax=Pedobacter alluvionis TaxID=475253 RepID=A0A497XYW6_9SPHI|nr:WcaF family extracellular polysaccharide biosynthesis acetyltransferase [Pedobacter alluvionis]RLJ73927.1 putative colanic acid biosynthesis acetyltransferase WcaF [Pedobacter alluvionis]TFB32469.1 colanic acid biosynthesis acetyltransferase WcaF [Pedobacter alluvionis]
MHNTDTVTGPSFSMKNRLARLVWGIVALFLFKLSPKPFHQWRVFLLKCFGAKIGKGVHVYPGVIIWAPWNIELGDECGIASGVNLYSQGKITIGKRAVISQGAHLCAGTHDYTLPGFPLIAMPIVIGDQVWVAAEVFVHPGITISEGAVIGARSVVTKNMPAWTVCSGHPCKPIKERVFQSSIKS